MLQVPWFPISLVLGWCSFGSDEPHTSGGNAAGIVLLITAPSIVGLILSTATLLSGRPGGPRIAAWVTLVLVVVAVGVLGLMRR